MSQDPFAALKKRQREMWASFGPTAMFTTPVAGHLVKFAGIDSGEAVLDVGTGTGVVAITAARAGAHVTALDLTPALLEQARENARIARRDDIVWTEGLVPLGGRDDQQADDLVRTRDVGVPVSPARDATPRPARRYRLAIEELNELGDDLIRGLFHEPVPGATDDDTFDIRCHQPALLNENVA